MGGTVDQTLRAITVLADRYVAEPSRIVTAIELMNEPLLPGVNIDQLRQFYGDGYGRVRERNPETAVILSDAFQGPSFWNDFNPGDNVIVDAHFYQIFTPDLIRLDLEGHISTACATAGTIQAANKATMVGEWSSALTDCAKYLNGRYTGSRFEGDFGNVPETIGSCAGKSSGTVEALSLEDKTNIRRFNEAQLDAYESGIGWVYWTWKTEGAPEWDMQAQLAAGLFPQPLTDRQFPGQCA